MNRMLKKLSGRRIFTVILIAFCFVLLAGVSAMADKPVNPRMAHVQELLRRSRREDVPPNVAGVKSGAVVTISGPESFAAGKSAVYTVKVEKYSGSYTVEYGMLDNDGANGGGFIYLLNRTSSTVHDAGKLMRVAGDFTLMVNVYDGDTCIGWEYYPVTVTGSNTMKKKIDEIVSKCRAKTTWKTALNLHDWLTHNCRYDYTFQYYGADIIVRGTGVCDAYSKAYLMLCKAAGIDCERVISNGMGHAWNAEKIGDSWYLTDVTWDDPGESEKAESGHEGYKYFCMNETMMRWDHKTNDWETDSGDAFARTCNSLDANYYIHENLWEDTALHYLTDESGNMDFGVRYTAAQEIQAGLDAGKLSFSVGWNNVIADKDTGTYYWDRDTVFFGMYLNAYKLNGAAFKMGKDKVVMTVNLDSENLNMKVYVSGYWGLSEQNTMVLPKNIKKIQNEAFTGIRATRIELPEGLEEIGKLAFSKSSVRIVVIPDSLKSIASDAFSGCEEILFLIKDNDAARTYAEKNKSILVVPLPQ